MSTFYRRVKKLFGWIFKNLYRVRIVNPEKEELYRPYVVCCNHTALMDVTVISLAMKRQVRYMAKKEVFKVPILKGFVTAMGAFPVDRRHGDVGAVKKTLELLKAGECVGVFPQGTRCPYKHPRDTEIKNGIGMFAVDNREELYAINDIAGDMGRKQALLLRITPGIDPHTYAAVNTGMVDSKFGSAIETGQAEELTRLALSLPNLELLGFHCHVGSQVFDSDVFLQTADIMFAFIAEMKEKLGFVTKKLDLGGGYGVRYKAEHPHIDIESNLLLVGQRVKELVAKFHLEMPLICLEPGRSIVADAGMTLYTMGTLKKIPGYKNYVSVDGGMADNPRYILYGSPYTLVPATKMNDARNMTCSVVGRCCESGDILQENVPMPDTLERGDLIACLTTGAYNYSMASNYNRLTRPPVVMLRAASPMWQSVGKPWKISQDWMYNHRYKSVIRIFDIR